MSESFCHTIQAECDCECAHCFVTLACGIIAAGLPMRRQEDFRNGENE